MVAVQFPLDSNDMWNALARRGRHPGPAIRAACGAVAVLLALAASDLQAAPSEPQRVIAPEGADATAASQRGFRGEPGDDTVFVPRVDRRPTLEDFPTLRPSLAVREQFALIEDFTQRIPSDGEPARFPTQALVGYDEEHLYVVFLAFDDEPEAVRARMSRREDIGADDQVWITLDPFRDQQRGYEFTVNPLGIQRDGLLTEGEEDVDFSFDTLWHSEGALRDDGYVAILAIPFKSLRFPNDDIQTWGMLLGRWVPRGASEESYWPRLTNRLEGTLNQAGRITGLQDVSPGRNLRLIPYGTFRSFRALDLGLPGGPDFVRDAADPNGGIDAKVVLKDTIVVDATINPDFSQIESDRPQNTVNERFEVFFPEKRPFFLENSNYFQTPLNLLFTRRIADPGVGLRATGKVGPWALGALAADDRAPGLRTAPDDPRHGSRARLGTLRVARDLGNQSRIGALWVDRTFAGSHNRVAGIDGRVKVGDNWVGEFQAVITETTDALGATRSGPGYLLEVARTGRSFGIRSTYSDLDENFLAVTGFVPRVGIRKLENELSYRFWTDGSLLQRWGPAVRLEQTWDRNGDRLDTTYNPWIHFQLPGRTNTGVFVWGQRTTLRPLDYGVLEAPREYDYRVVGFWLNTQLLEWLQLDTWNNVGRRLNFVPAAGLAPEVGTGREGSVAINIRPNDRVRVGWHWVYSTLNEPDRGGRIFRSDIVRGRLDYQFSRELSLRLIAQYEVLATDPELTFLADRRNLNADVLFTYLVNPWTSLYAGYNRNAQNLELLSSDGLRTLRRTDGPLLPDANQIFLKLSYLFSY